MTTRLVHNCTVIEDILWGLNTTYTVNHSKEEMCTVDEKEIEYIKYRDMVFS